MSATMDNANPLVSEIALPTRRRRIPEVQAQNNDSIHALWASVKQDFTISESEVASSHSGSDFESSIYEDDSDVDPIDAREIYGEHNTHLSMRYSLVI